MNTNESYKHYFAKEALKHQLLNGIYGEIPLRIDTEKQFVCNGKILFIVDLASYNENGLNCIYEVVVSNPISIDKRIKIHNYFNKQNYLPNIIEISADYILKQIKS